MTRAGKRRCAAMPLGLIALSLSAACSTLGDARVARLDGIERDLIEIAEEDPRFEVLTIGDVAYRGVRFPIIAVEYRPPGGSAHSVLSTAGVHGDEAGGVEAVYRMILDCRARDATSTSSGNSKRCFSSDAGPKSLEARPPDSALFRPRGRRSSAASTAYTPAPRSSARRRARRRRSSPSRREASTISSRRSRGSSTAGIRRA